MAGISRRGLFKRAAAVAGGIIAAPFMRWLPQSAATASAASVSANTIITPEMIAKEALAQLECNLRMGVLVHREYVNEFAKAGGKVNIRRRVRFDAPDS